MNKNIIKSYAKNITKEDIIKFATKENINITENETNIIYNAVHNDIDVILSENALHYLESKKEYLSNNVYEKIKEYFYKYEKFTK